MNKFYIKDLNVPDGKPYRLYERDENGQLIREYKAYYNARGHTYRLYPAYNPYAMNSGTVGKKCISANLVRIEV